jgi:hypothetical protein
MKAEGALMHALPANSSGAGRPVTPQQDRSVPARRRPEMLGNPSVAGHESGNAGEGG